MIAIVILAPVARRDLDQGEWKGVVTVGYWWVETQYRAFLLGFHDVVVSAFKFGGS